MWREVLECEEVPREVWGETWEGRDVYWGAGEVKGDVGKYRGEL